MFTGIVQSCQTIQQIQRSATVWRVHVSVPPSRFQPGDSILVQGVCSTVVSVDDTELVIEYMSETIRLTNIEHWKVGKKLHIEAPVTLQTPLSGWLVTGHVDATLEVLFIQTGMDYVITIKLPQPSAALVMLKGGITINGVNLTVTELTADAVTVQLVPYTLTHTMLGDLRVGDWVNVEFDYIAKLAQRYWGLHLPV